LFEKNQGHDIFLMRNRVECLYGNPCRLFIGQVIDWHQIPRYEFGESAGKLTVFIYLIPDKQIEFITQVIFTGL
jgi:hypothetical protein